MPTQTRWAFRIYFAALVLTPLVGFLDPAPWPEFPEGSEDILALVVLMFFLPLFTLLGFIIHRAYRGRNWARVALLAIHVLALIPYAEQLQQQLTAAPLPGALQLLLALAQTAALLLMFGRASNEWYRVTKSQSTGDATGVRSH